MKEEGRLENYLNEIKPPGRLSEFLKGNKKKRSSPVPKYMRKLVAKYSQCQSIDEKLNVIAGLVLLAGLGSLPEEEQVRLIMLSTKLSKGGKE